jgi:hypothetical protein
MLAMPPPTVVPLLPVLLLLVLLLLVLPPARLSASARPVPDPAVAVDVPGGGSAPAASVVDSCLGALGSTASASCTSAEMIAMRFFSFCSTCMKQIGRGE